MKCHASNVYLAKKNIKLHANQQKILLEIEQLKLERLSDAQDLNCI